MEKKKNESAFIASDVIAIIEQFQFTLKTIVIDYFNSDDGDWLVDYNNNEIINKN